MIVTWKINVGKEIQFWLKTSICRRKCTLTPKNKLDSGFPNHYFCYLMNKIIIAFVLACLPFTSFAQCKDSTRADPYYHCDLPYQPVCGCDNVTYRNTCAALNWGGIINSGFSLPWTDGICQNTNFDFDFVPNPVSAISQSLSDSHLHIYINETLLPTGYVVYIVDMFNKVLLCKLKFVLQNATFFSRFTNVQSRFSTK